LRGLAGGDLGRIGKERIEVGSKPALVDDAGELLAEPVAAGVGFQPAVPLGPGGGPAASRLAPGCSDIGRDLKGRNVPAELLAGGSDLVGSKRRAMGRSGPLLGRSAIADDRLAADERGPWVGD